MKVDRIIIDIEGNINDFKTKGSIIASCDNIFRFNLIFKKRRLKINLLYGILKVLRANEFIRVIQSFLN